MACQTFYMNIVGWAILIILIAVLVGIIASFTVNVNVKEIVKNVNWMDFGIGLSTGAVDGLVGEDASSDVPKTPGGKVLNSLLRVGEKIVQNHL